MQPSSSFPVNVSFVVADDVERSLNGSADDDEAAYRYVCKLYDIVIEAGLMGVLCLFGFVGNSLSTLCLLRDRSKSATPFLLVSLETADTLFLVTVLLLRVFTTLASVDESDEYDAPPWVNIIIAYIGKYVYPWAMIAETGTVYLTILVTVNRYIAVCRPYDATDTRAVRSQAKRHVMLVCAFSVVFNATRFLEYEIIAIHAVDQDNDTMVNSTWLLCNETWLNQNDVYKYFYSTMLYSLVMFLIPLVSLVIFNYKLMTTLRRTRHKRDTWRSSATATSTHQRLSRQSSSGDPQSNSGSGAAANSRSEDDITLMLIVVVVVFVLCQSPALVTQVLIALLFDGSICGSPLFYYVRLSDLLVVTNSSVNFIVYCLCSRRFRHILADVMGCRLSREHRVSSQQRRQHPCKPVVTQVTVAEVKKEHPKPETITCSPAALEAAVDVENKLHDGEHVQSVTSLQQADGNVTCV